MLAQDDRLFFIHIPKTAGTSLIPLIDARFRQDEICPAQLWREIVKVPQEDLPRYRLFRGHFGAHGLDPFLPKPPVYMTMLREPLKLAYSTYQFVLREPNTRIHRLVKSEKMTFEDFVRHPKTRARISDKMARNLSFHLEHDPDTGPIFLSRHSQAVVDQWVRDHGVRPAGPERLKRAMDQLDACAFVGVVEQFDASMALMSWIFDWPPLGQTEKLRTSNKSLQLDDLSPECLAELKKANALDIEVYARGLELFEGQLSAMLEDLAHWIEPGEVMPARFDDDPVLVNRLLERRHRARRLEREGAAESTVRVDFADALPGSGWHGREYAPADQQWFRWTGPSTDATLDLHVDRSEARRLTFRVIDAIDRDTLDALEVLADGDSLELEVIDGGRSAVRVIQTELPALASDGPHLTRLTFSVPATDSKHNRHSWEPDTRRVGVAVQWIDVSPVDLVPEHALPSGIVEVTAGARLAGRVVSARNRLKQQLKHTPVIGSVLQRVAHKIRT